MEQKYFLIYDSDCGICSESVSWLYKSSYHRQFSIIPFTEFDFSNYPSISMELAMQTVIVVNKETGECFTYGNAILQILLIMGGNYRKISKLISQYRLTSALNTVYKVIAKNRAKISQVLGFKTCKIIT